MGKIVKYCAACDESFAEKFGFCPNCGQAMTAFEMNPVTQQPAVSETAKTEAVVEEPAVQMTAPVALETAPKIEQSPVAETVAVSAGQTQTFFNEMETEDVADVTTEDEPTAPKTFAAAAGANGNGNGDGNYQTTNDNFRAAEAMPEDDGFHITVIEEKNSKQRNGLLLASMVLILTLSLGGTVYSLFTKDPGVGAIGDEGLFALVVVDNAPMELEVPPKEDKPGEESSGGGGGGRKDNEPVGKGTIPPQLKERFITPSNEDISVSKPSIPITRATLGPNDIIPPNRSERNGDPNSTNPNKSSGIGPDNLGMGQNGSGGFGNNGRDGMGSNGDGGIGNSPGDGYGNNPGGNGGNNTPKPPPPPPAKPVGVTTKVKIISKPKPGYTNEARQNQVTGTVRLRVIFTASGQVGSISPVSGLPNGLTEQAIAAARGIRFEPAMKNGVPVSSQSIVEYTFSIY